jgi:hypothetical protein
VQNLLSFSFLSENVKLKIHRTVILPVVLYGCEIWSLILWEVYRLRVLVNRVPWRVVRPKRDEATGEWRRLHNKEFYAQHFSPNFLVIIKKTEMGMACSTCRERRVAYRGLVG